MPEAVKNIPTVDKKLGPGTGPGLPGPNGNGSNGWHQPKDDGHRRALSLTAYRLMMWMVLGAVVMMFAALSSVYIALSGNDQWQPVKLPRVLILSTGIILASSVSISVARRSLKQGKQTRYRRLLLTTLVLGFCFIGLQLFGWRQLVAAGFTYPAARIVLLFTCLPGARSPPARRHFWSELSGSSAIELD